MNRIIYHEYETESEAFTDAEVRGSILVHVENGGSIFEIRIYERGRFIRLVESSLDSSGELFLNGGYIVISGSLSPDNVKSTIATLTDRYFETLKSL